MEIERQAEGQGLSLRIRRGAEMLIRRTIYPYLKFPYHRFLIWNRRRLIQRYGEAFVVRKHFFRNHGFWPNLDRPRTYQEKLAWIKLNVRDPLMVTCADKHAVRDYVKEKVGAEYLIPLLGVYQRPDEIPFAAYQAPFVLKVNRACGGNVFCLDKRSFNVRKAKRILRHYLKINPYYYDCEWAYRDIPPRIVCERVLLDERNRLPADYKFLCFNGEPLLIQLHLDRFGNHRHNFYDVEWRLLPVNKQDSDQAVARPERLEEMIEIARRLSAPFDFVRVDLYQVRGKVHVGEMTFYPHGGSGRLSPSRYEIEYGEKLRLRGVDSEKVKQGGFQVRPASLNQAC